MPGSLGFISQPVFWKDFGNFISQHFTVGTVSSGTQYKVYAGQQVCLNVDGTIRPATLGELTINIIGVALKMGSVGQVITVGMGCKAIVMGEAGVGGLVAGPVMTGGVDLTPSPEMNGVPIDWPTNDTMQYNNLPSTSNTGESQPPAPIFSQAATVDNTNIAGWALGTGNVGDSVRIALI